MTRTLYTAAPIRAADLQPKDVLWHDAEWRVVLDVWHDEDRAELNARAVKISDAELDATLHHLNGRGEYILVRLLTETPGDGPGEHRYLTPRSCDLVTIQVPVPERSRDVGGGMGGVFLSLPELAQYAGRPLTEVDAARIASLVPESGVPQAISQIVKGWDSASERVVGSGDASAGV